jgi:hypothetical protein
MGPLKLINEEIMDTEPVVVEELFSEEDEEIIQMYQYYPYYE